MPASKGIVIGGSLVVLLAGAGFGYYLYTKKATVAAPVVVTPAGTTVGGTGSTVAALTPVTLAAAPAYSDATSTSVPHIVAYTTHDGQTITGTDLNNSQEIDLSSCQEYCSAYPGCVGGVYGKNNQSCKLKSAYDPNGFTDDAKYTTFVKS